MNIRILIADDNVLVRRNLRAFLTGHCNWEVCAEAENGREAIARAQSIQPDVVILDLAMPVMDGLQAASSIHQLQPGLPMVIYTAHSSPELEIQATNAGVHKVVSKTNPDELLSALKSALVKYPAVRPTRPALA